jgi:UDP-N-acetylmuramate-alanine ligase
MHIHFIAIGGSAMHNLAIALHKKGYRVTGSDDKLLNIEIEAPKIWLLHHKAGNLTY